VIIVVNGATIPAGPSGSLVTINGAVFGGAQGTGQVVFTPQGGGVPKAAIILNPIDWTDGTIVTTVPDGLTPGPHFVAVTTGNGLTSNAYAFQVTPAAFVPATLAWTASSALPAPQSGTGVTFVPVGSNNYVYAVGGATSGGTPTSAVYYASVSTGGSLGAWQSTTSLPAALAFAGVTSATQYNTSITSASGYLYAVGGATDAGGTPSTGVYRAAINANGSLGGWSNVATLPAGLRSVGAIIHYGSLYVVGGAGAGNNAVATVFRGPVQVDGSFKNGTLTLQGAPLPAPRARFGFGAAGLNLYVIGGDSGSVAPNDGTVGTKQTATIFYGRLANNTHDVTGWTTNSTPLPAPRSALTAILFSNYILVTGGLYGGGAAEEIYASINLNTSGVGAFTTSSGTIGRNLFNQGAAGYLAGDGSFHIAVVGGDDASAVGTRRAESFTY
jgi:N-acetylneuraminic acid mutarotase